MIKILGNGYMAVDSATNQLVLLEKESTIPLTAYIINPRIVDVSTGNPKGILASTVKMIVDPATNEGYIIPEIKLSEYVDETYNLKKELHEDLNIKHWKVWTTNDVFDYSKTTKFTKQLEVKPYHDVISKKLIMAINASSVELPTDRYDFFTSKIRELEAGKATLATLYTIMEVIGVKITDIKLERTISYKAEF